MTNDHPQFDGMDLDVEFGDDGKPESATCRIYRKDRAHPTSITEYFSECFRNTEPWKQYPARMLRHKALIQAARIAFGFSGIYDEDEGKDVAGIRNVTPSPAKKARTAPAFALPEPAEKPSDEPKDELLPEADMEAPDEIPFD
jgi:hypothetical protein